MIKNRIDWVDYGKGICIILVVMMHSTLNYGHMVDDTGWMHDVVAFAKPFRMPDFFLIAGLFLSRSIHGPLVDYIDRKVVHFAYFYVLWLILQTAAFEAGMLLSDPVGVGMIFLKQLVFPASSLWFIHQLLFFYAATRLLRRVPTIIVFAGAALAHAAFYAGWIAPDWSVIERFANWYVFFFAGYAFAPFIFKLADTMREHWLVALATLAAWAVWNGQFVAMGVSELPVVSLVLGFSGAFAIVAVAALLARFDIGHVLRYAGKHSIVIYLTFFIPMKVAQKGLAMTGLIPDVGWASLAILTFAVAAPLAFHFVIRKTPLVFLYERPAVLRINGSGKPRPAKESLAPVEPV
jgi:uncharacterized membrane protein YcfT